MCSTQLGGNSIWPLTDLHSLARVSSTAVFGGGGRVVGKVLATVC